MTVLVGAATALYLVLGYPYGPVVASLVVALVAAVVTGHRLTAWLVAAGVLTAHAVAVVRDPGSGGPGPAPQPPSRGRCSSSRSARWSGCAANAP